MEDEFGRLRRGNDPVCDAQENMGRTARCTFWNQMRVFLIPTVLVLMSAIVYPMVRQVLV